MWKEFVTYVGTEVRRALFPQQPPCPGCHQPKPRPTYGLCRSCHDRIAPVIGPACERCGRPLRGRGELLCLACAESVRYFTVARAPAVYADAMRAYIRRFKYGGERDLGRALALMMTAYVVKQPVLWPIDVVVPLPLHRRRLEERGFNQAELLARPLAADIGRPMGTDALTRPKATTKQSLLPGQARRDNVEGAFVVPRPAAVAGRKVLLIDDVLTSGATADEAAKVLLQAGALRVAVLCAAVAIHDYDWQLRHTVSRTEVLGEAGMLGYHASGVSGPPLHLTRR